jgi:glycosyltransferase involved in cell wall biosynthesis
MSAPLVTCVVPVHDGARFLGEALDSVLAQTYEPLEIVVVDDGSTDDTATVARRYERRIRFVRQEHAGPSAARNRGTRLARGEFLAFLDADDLWLPHKTVRQMSRFAARATLDISVSQFEDFWSPGLRAADAEGPGHDLAGPQTGFRLPAAVVRRSVFEAVGPLDADLRHGEGNEWFIRALDHRAVIEFLPEVLTRRRLHDRNMTRLEANEAREWLPRLAKMVLDRRRRDPTAPDPFRLDPGPSST